MQTSSKSSPSSTKDIIIMFIAISPQTNYVLWGVLLPYYFSYLKHFNPEISFNQVFAASCFFYVGLLSCSWLYPSLVSIFGLKNIIRLSGTIYALNAVGMHCFSSISFVCLNVTLIGFCIKAMFITNMLYFSTKHEENAKKCIGVANLGFTILSFIWSYLYFLLINPGNEGMTEIAYNGTTEERYFKWEIAQRFKFTFNLHGLYCFVITIVCSMLIENPEQYKNNIYKLWNWCIGKNKQDWEETWSERHSIEVSNISLSIPKINVESFYSSLNYSKNTDKSIELLSHSDKESNEYKTVDEIMKEELRKPKFWILFIISIIKFLFIYYLIDVNKILGLIILKNDELVTQCYNIVSITSGIVSSFIVYMIERIGLINGYIITSIIVILVEIYFMGFTKEFPLMFILFLSLSLLCMTVIGQLNNLVLIHFYTPELTLHLQKIFDFNLFVANVIIVLCNTFLFQQTNFFPVFFCFLIFDVVGLVLLIIYLKPLDKSKNV